MRPSLLLLLAIGCVRDVGPGPNLGRCAAPPQGSYTYGEIGIGTCLAGPTDLAFFEQDGVTWLAVSNADPFLNFDSGSVLLIDWSTVDLTTDRNPMDRVDAFAMPTDHYVGGVAYVADDVKQVLLVPGRLSEDAPSTSHRDRLHVVDVSDPTNPVPWALGDTVRLRDDPQPIVADPSTDRAFVANLTDHSVSVLDTSGAPISAIDLAPSARVGLDVLVDADDSGSHAEVDGTVFEAKDVPDDTWTLTWIEGTTRAWVTDDTGGLVRYVSGGADYVPAGFGVEVDPADSLGLVDEVVDPLFVVIEGVPVLEFADQGDIWSILPSTASTWDWGSLSGLVFSAEEGWDAWLGAPAVLLTDDLFGTYYDARTAPGEPASIGVALAQSDGSTVRQPEPLLAPSAPWVSFEQPYIRTDAFTKTHRMWLSLWDGEQWSIGESDSVDGLAWSPVSEALRLDGLDVAAPAVLWANGRYQLWCAVGDGTSWWIATAWSYDGSAWSEPVLAFEVPGTYDRTDPPRAAIQLDATGGFRVEGRNNGQALGGVATSDGAFTLAELGFTLHASNGFEISPRALTGATGGMLPGSYATVDGVGTLYVTAVDRGGRRGVGALVRHGDGWIERATDIAPRGGNKSAPRDPVVFGADGAWQMVYAATDDAGVPRLARATSTDGLAWTAATLRDPALDTWETSGRVPHFVEATDTGWRLWYTGQEVERSHIGVLESADGEAWTAVPGPTDPWILGPGDAGQYDDTAVRDPVVVREAGLVHLYYGAFDGANWRLGHATAAEGDLAFTPVVDPRTGLPAPVLDLVSDSFCTAGVRSPVVVPSEEGLDLLFAGSDGERWRVGRAIGSSDVLFPAQRFPTDGDSLVFDTSRGDPLGGVIELEQTVDGFPASGLGVSSMTLDPARGFLYLTAKPTIQAANYIYVVDARDDSAGAFVDTNALDIEGVLAVSTASASGFRSTLPVPGTDLLLATAQNPDALMMFDLSKLHDDASKDVITDALVAALPMRRLSSSEPGRPFQDEDEGESTQARMTGAGMALVPDGRTVLVTHFRDNSVLAFDLAVGEQIARIGAVGENPHVIRVTPDGRYAVVANYLGEVDPEVQTVSSTLAVVDIDPTSETFLEVVTWLVNL